MVDATSCGGVVIFRGKILLLYKNYKNKYEGWVLPKGTVEAGEDYKETATREVLEEAGLREFGALNHCLEYTIHGTLEELNRFECDIRLL